MTTELIRGNRYRILPGAHRAGVENSGVSRLIGQEATLLSERLYGDGGVWVRVDGEGSTFVLPAYLEPVAVVQSSTEGDTTATTELAFGRFYTLTPEGVSRACQYAGSSVTATTTVILLDNAADHDGDVRIALGGPSGLATAYVKAHHLIPTLPPSRSRSAVP
jgi:hypothetical protein